jgi:glycosyltransferase involved in cell wall biosynthesis
MRILQLYNRYQSGGGGETRVVELIEQVLLEKKHTVKTLIRDSNDIQGPLSKLSLVFTAAYSPSAKREIHQEILSWKPDVVHVHNLYPLFSPSVLAACTEFHVPVVMSVHNYGLSCPVATHFRDGKPCQLCLGGREYHCILENCKGDITKSVSYALRSCVARVDQQFQKGVSLFLPVSHFVKKQMIDAGYSSDRIEVLENAVPIPGSIESCEGDYVAYLGTMKVEKGVEDLLAAAARLPDCRFVFAGDGPDLARWAAAAPANCSFVGRQNRTAMEQTYKRARFTVVPSTWWEPFGLVVIEAMSYGKPVIAARSGALPELVEDGVTGLTYDPGNVDGLTNAITSLWNAPARTASMGLAGRQMVEKNFNLAHFTDKLIGAYERVQSQSGK